MLKRLFCTLSLLSAAFAANAAHVEEEALPVSKPLVPVTIPFQAGSWLFALEGLHMSAANGDFEYITKQGIQTNVPENNVNSLNFRARTLDPDSEWGGRVDLVYNFDGKGRYVVLSYSGVHVRDTERATRSDVNSEFMSGPGVLTPILPNPAVQNNVVIQRLLPDTVAGDFPNGWDFVRAKSENDYDAIDLVLGQRMEFNDRVVLSAFGGLRYAYIDVDGKSHYLASTQNPGAPAQEQALGRLHISSDIHMVGPRAGGDAIVRLGYGFSIKGTIAASILAGDIDNRTTTQLRGFVGDVAVGNQNYDHVAVVTERVQLIPEMDARIGINFSGNWSDCFAYGIEVGYEATNYFDVVDNSLFSFIDTSNHDNDFGLYGIYIRAQIELA